MIWHTKNIQDNAIKTLGLHSAKLYSDAISAFRTIYTSEVVAVAEQHGLRITHDYLNKKSIPLPATLSILLGKKIGENGSGANARLYSPYPFPWREKTGGLKDDFSKKAWAHFLENTNEPYFEFYTDNNKRLLRYAVPDKMRESCINCHNTHPDSPKINWNINDIRGVLDITIPLDKAIAETDNDLIFTIVIYFILAILGIVGIIFMITKHKTESRELENSVKLRTAQLEREKARAIKASKAKTEFLSNMSHELRTPMNAILGFGQLLEMNAKTATDRDNCKEILTAGNHLLKLINEVLDLAKIEAGKININTTPVSVDELVNETIKLLSPIANSKAIHIHDYKLTKLKVYADQTKIKQVMVNLVSNAIKYNNINGSIEINAIHKEPGTIRINVIDTGLGLNTSQIKNLFQPFERVGAENSGINGTGIGLAISKQLIEAMNGRVGVESTPHKGSTFWIELNSVNE